MYLYDTRKHRVKAASGEAHTVLEPTCTSKANIFFGK